MRIIYFIVILCSVHFFGLHFRLGEYAYDLIDFLYFGVSFLVLGKYLLNKTPYKFSKKHRLFSRPINLFFIALIVSTISGFYYHGQSPFLTLLAMRYFLYFLIYFILIRFGIRKEIVLKSIMVGAVIYMIVFTIQVILYPTAIVPGGDSTGFSRGFLRLRLEGVGLVTLSGLYALNRYLVSRNSTKSLFFFILCFIYVFILGFRTLLLTYLFSSFLIFLFTTDSLVKTIKFLVPIGVLLVLSFQLPIVQNFIFGAIEQTREQAAEGDTYIRVLAFDFLFNEVNVNFGSLLFGNGMPFLGTKYGNLVLDYGARQNGFISADLGLIGFTFNYGLLTLFAFLNILRIAILKKVSKHSVYLKVFFIYLLISSFTTAEIFRAGMFGVEMIALYLITYVSFYDELNETSN